MSVSELLGSIGRAIEREFSLVLVAGELSSFKRHHLSGHCYFSLSDDKAVIDCVMWKGDVARLKFDPEVGDEVLCRGRVGIYDKQGRMQLYVRTMLATGEGAAQKALIQLKRRLEAEGLFSPERKRGLPFLPSTIGVVTSRSGAALHDILSTLRRRHRGVHVVISPAAVQGADAPAKLRGALADLRRLGRCDVVIIGRGGGASEDLAAFNDEGLARDVAAFPVPVISAVGHEIDLSLCDLVADYRAATPSAAAEAVVPVRAELEADLRELASRLHGGAIRRIEALRYRVRASGGELRDPALRVAETRQRLDELGVALQRGLFDRYFRAVSAIDGLRLRLRDPSVRVGVVRKRVDELGAALGKGAADRYWRAASRLGELGSRLDALSPLAVLERGYCLASSEGGEVVSRVSQLAAGDRLDIRFFRGRALTQVLGTTEE
ncbi:MAG: exodeoxyribonuclease VII large subunit [Candidatus Binatia bacterium]